MLGSDASPTSTSPGVARRQVTFLAPPRKVTKRRRPLVRRPLGLPCAARHAGRLRNSPLAAAQPRTQTVLADCPRRDCAARRLTRGAVGGGGSVGWGELANPNNNFSAPPNSTYMRCPNVGVRRLTPTYTCLRGYSARAPDSFTALANRCTSLRMWRPNCSGLPTAESNPCATTRAAMSGSFMMRSMVE